MTGSSWQARGALVAGRRRLLVTGVSVALSLALVLGACSGSSGRHAAPPPQSTANAATIPSTTTATTTATTVPGAHSTTSTTTPQTSGPRTVLSPIGLNVRAQSAKTAAVLGSAAQGVVLTVLSHIAGWFQVKGATVTGWMSDDPTLTAQGKFNVYTESSGQFGALYPLAWTTTVTPPASVVFHAPTAGETIVVTTAANVGLLGAGRTGYHTTGSDQVVVCGITSYLTTFTKAAGAAATTPPPGGAASQQYLAQVRVALDPTHALGIDANLTALSQLQTVHDFVYSVTFPFPQCQH